MATAVSHTSPATRKWLRSQASCCRLWILVAVGAGFGSGLLIIGQSWILAHLIHGAVIGKGAMKDFMPLLALLLAIQGGRAGLVWAKEWAGFHAGAVVRRRIRTTLLEAIVARGPTGLSRQSSGAITSTLIEQVEGLHDFFAYFFPQMALSLLVPSAILICVLPLTWAAALILLTTAPLIPLFMVLVGMGADAVSQRHFTALARMSSYFLDLLQGLPTLKLLGRNRDRQDEIAEVSTTYRQRTMAVLRIAFLSSAVLEFFSALAIAMVAVYLGTHYLGYVNFGAYGKSLTLETGLFILFLAPEFYAPLRELGARYHARATALGAAEEIRKVLDSPEMTPLAPRLQVPLTAESEAPRLSLRNLGHTYPHRRQAALRDISLDIQAGEKIALVGTSGAGKTTLLSVLMGFLNPSRGDIAVNGSSLKAVNPEWWRGRLTWIGQRPVLFSGTLVENICLGTDTAKLSEATLREALRQARVDQFLDRLPQGLQTPLGDLGSRLSRGQAQRVALARALMKNAPLVIMDEPTAGLDRVNERLVMEGIGQLSRNRTVVMATHRLDPTQMQWVDRIAVLDEGRLAELGTYQDLISREGVFHRLANQLASRVENRAAKEDHSSLKGDR